MKVLGYPEKGNSHASVLMVGLVGHAFTDQASSAQGHLMSNPIAASQAQTQTTPYTRKGKLVVVIALQAFR